MSKIVQAGLAVAEVGLSRAGRYFPGLAAKVTGLDEEADIVLQWHFARRVPHDDLLTIPGHPDAKANNVRTWGPYVLAVQDSLLAEATARGRRPAMAHRVGWILLSGEDPHHPKSQFLRTIYPETTRQLQNFPPELSQERLVATVTRVGEFPYIGAIGTIGHSVHDFEPLPTYNLGPLPAAVRGLRRV